ncbi:hypothetical protein DMENIID0001_058880 [Sergentomyia squamirostris]
MFNGKNRSAMFHFGCTITLESGITIPEGVFSKQALYHTPTNHLHSSPEDFRVSLLGEKEPYRTPSTSNALMTDTPPYTIPHAFEATPERSSLWVGGDV